MLWHWWSTIPSERRELCFVMCMHMYGNGIYSKWMNKDGIIFPQQIISYRKERHITKVFLSYCSGKSNSKKLRIIVFKVSATHPKYHFLYFILSILFFAQWCLVWWPCIKHNVLWLILLCTASTTQKKIIKSNHFNRLRQTPHMQFFSVVEWQKKKREFKHRKWKSN